MLLTKQIEMMITSRNAKYYANKGYEIPMEYSNRSKKMIPVVGAKILVDICDVSTNSKYEILYQCDNCQQTFSCTICNWNKRKYLDKGVFCKDCAAKVLLPMCIEEKYGVDNSSKLSQVKEKRKRTNLERYGSEYAAASSVIRDKIIKTNLERYGVENPMQNEYVKQKSADTNMRKYGVVCSLCNDEVKRKARATCMERYGVPVSSQSKEVQAKARLTLYKNGTTPTSMAEQSMCKTLEEMFGKDNCFRNYPEGNLSLDCLVKIDGVNIDFEYDGIYWHNGREDKDRARNAVLMNLGYRIVRIKGNNCDDTPTSEQIQNAVDYLIKENHHLAFIDMNN